ncbi:MAG TPA: hypothetical protein VGL53_00595 [Bryobacteraceae bacterium]|jgi:hypothetical protein
MRRRIAIGAASLLTGIAAWLGAQALAPVKPASELMPSGALFYVEAHDFAKLVSAWDSSPEQKAWLESANYQSWTRSHLAVRLADVRKSYAEAAEVAEDAPFLDGVAGQESAVAFYNIGKLEFLYITRLESARFAGSVLGKIKQKFEARKAAGHDYFVLSKGESTIAFALVDDRLLLATREDLISSSLRLLAGEKIGALREERWFDDALAKAPTGEVPDIRFVADLDRTTKTHQFRSYWVHRNVDEVRQFASEVADLKLNTSDIHERRVFVRRETQQEGLEKFEPAVDDVLRYATPDAGFTQAIARPDAGLVASLLGEKLFGHTKSTGQSDRVKFAPGAAVGSEAGGEDDYETRVDAPVVAETLTNTFAPLDDLAKNTDALMQAGISRSGTGEVLPGLDSAVALHGIADWKPEDVKRTLGDVASSLWSVGPRGLQWMDRNGVSELNSVSPLRFTIDGRVLVISTSPELMTHMLAGRRKTVGSPAGASYTATLRYGQELPGFARMMRLMDYPSLPQGQQQDAREPLFFSENMLSLMSSLGRLDSAAITSRDTGTLVTESVVYRKK